MWLAWVFTPRTSLVIAIIDKTVLNQKAQEHSSLIWVLNNNRINITANKSYQVSRDYFGFFPLKDKKFEIKGLERFSSIQLNQLSNDADVAYFTDTYGIYKNEWYGNIKDINERSRSIYGGMSSQDVEFLKDMKAKHKLIIAEFNTICSPTSVDNRTRFESLFGMHWTGWTARYFDSFDTTVNKEIPRWLINDYERQHDKKWPFHKSGIAFVENTDVVVILEDGTHLSDPMPHIITAGFGQQKFSLPRIIKYPFWFDIITPELPLNHIISRFNISVNTQGAQELKKHKIPTNFPAITMHKDKDYQFYYFSGDFCNNKVGMGTSCFKGVGAFRCLFYYGEDGSESQSFFWNFYRPMMSNILDENVVLKN